MSNRYTYSVPFTAEQLHQDYTVAGMTQREVGDKWGVSQRVVWKALLKSGIASRRATARTQRLERNNNWKGGRILQAVKPERKGFADSGYFYIYRPEHPNAQKRGYVAEHIVVALEAKGLNRLPRGFCVHHINLQKQDNAASNLAICDHRTHQLYHTQLEELAARLLLKAGLITFKEGEGYVEA